MPQIKGLGLGQIHRYCIFSFFGFMQIASCICFCFVSFSFGLKFSKIIFTCLQLTIMIWNKVKWESNRLKRCKLNHSTNHIYWSFHTQKSQFALSQLSHLYPYCPIKFVLHVKYVYSKNRTNEWTRMKKFITVNNKGKGRSHLH